VDVVKAELLSGGGSEFEVLYHTQMGVKLFTMIYKIASAQPNVRAWVGWLLNTARSCKNNYNTTRQYLNQLAAEDSKVAAILPAEYLLK
jgi:hypothetical protein